MSVADVCGELVDACPFSKLNEPICSDQQADRGKVVACFVLINAEYVFNLYVASHKLLSRPIIV